MPHLAQVIPPGIGVGAPALVVTGRAAGRAGPGATSGGLPARPASPFLPDTGARAGGSIAAPGAGLADDGVDGAGWLATGGGAGVGVGGTGWALTGGGGGGGGAERTIGGGAGG